MDTYFFTISAGDVDGSGPNAGIIAAEDALVDPVTDGVLLDVPHSIQQFPVVHQILLPFST